MHPMHPNCSRKLRKGWYKNGPGAVTIDPLGPRAVIHIPPCPSRSLACPCRVVACPARPSHHGVPLIIRAGLAPTSQRVLPYLPFSQPVGATFRTAKPRFAPRGTRTFRAPRLRAASMTSIYIGRVPKSRNAASVGRNKNCRTSMAPPADVASDQVGIHGFEGRRRKNAPRQHRSCESPARTARFDLRAFRACRRFDPLGTWQYAQAMCFPSGARVGSNRLGCASNTNGRSGVLSACELPPRRR